ncbi:MAG: SMC-Scp complex subunit ScpB [Candidatus Hodarchaeales archaeon]|jgi:chromosome segregation and condensation protein ScpB
MFRLFRRKKKETPDKQVEEKEIKKVTSETEPSDIISEETEPSFEFKETPFEEKFGQYAKILPESILEAEEREIDQYTMLPFIESLVNQNDSISSFISPQIITRYSSMSSSVSDSFPLIREELPPISLEERIEGALFAIGRPINISEIIDNFDEDSPTIKRATRRLSRKKKRSSALIIHEISKDRWVLQLNPIFHEFFQPLKPELFLSTSERRVLTEIAYRQPISLALVKKMVTGIGPIKVTEICQKLEENGFVISEKRSRSLIYTSTPKFARAFGFDNESRRLKLQMLWRLKRLMGSFEEEEPEELDDPSLEDKLDEKDEEIVQEDSIDGISDEQTDEVPVEQVQSWEDEKISPPIDTTVPTNEDNREIDEITSDIPDNNLKLEIREKTESQSSIVEENQKIPSNSDLIPLTQEIDQHKAIKEISFGKDREITEEE